MSAADVTHPGAGTPRRGSGEAISNHELYELCVQHPGAMAAMLRAIHGGSPRVLIEDFCGSAAVSRAWAARPGCRAIASDIDGAVLAVAASHRAPRVRLTHADALRPETLPGSSADVIFVGNFSVCEIHQRAALVAYFGACAQRLRAGGSLVCDTYGGATAFARGGMTRVIHPPAGTGLTRIRYSWEQRRADPLTARVVNALHFRLERKGRVVDERTDAFVYTWRLWSVPELRDAMTEAGFTHTDVYDSLPDAQETDGTPIARPVTNTDDLGESFVVCVVGRKPAREARLR